MKGVYSYTDKKTNEIVYIGRDSHLHTHRSRHKAHLSKTLRDAQVINRVLQDNPDRYEYDILCEGDFTNDELNMLEMGYIGCYNPKFNFTIGGGGVNGYKHSLESRKKMSQSSKGIIPWMKGKKHTRQVKEYLSRINTNEVHPQWKDYARVVNDGYKDGRKCYCIRYKGKSLKSSYHIRKLYDWFSRNYPNEYLYMEAFLLC